MQKGGGAKEPLLQLRVLELVLELFLELVFGAGFGVNVKAQLGRQP